MIHLLRTIFCLTTSLVLLWCTPAQVKGDAIDSLQIQALLAEGFVFYKRLDNQLAISTYRKAFSLDSTSFDVLSRLARTATYLGKDFQADNQNKEAEQTYIEAVRYAQVLEENYANLAKTHFFLALTKGNLALFQGGRQKVEIGREVEIHCKKGLALDSTDVQLLVAYAVFNREVASASWMERALAQTLFGSIPEGSKERAVLLLSRAVAINPDLHIAQFELARSLIAVGKPEEAIMHLKLAQSLPAQTTQDNRNRQLAIRLLDRMSR